MTFTTCGEALETAYRDERLEFDLETGAAAVDSSPLVLTRKERELLSLLVENRGEIVPRAVLLQRVWGYSREIRTRTLDVHIRRLRKKLGAYGEHCIETVFGIGYRFQGYRPARFAAFAGEMVPAETAKLGAQW
jgi:DNA-binding response OmpR family regulator